VTDTIQASRHRVRDGGKSGPDLDGLGRSIPLVKKQEKSIAPNTNTNVIDNMMVTSTSTEPC
jgi:hypothetical protein